MKSKGTTWKLLSFFFSRCKTVQSSSCRVGDWMIISIHKNGDVSENLRSFRFLLVLTNYLWYPRDLVNQGKLIIKIIIISKYWFLDIMGMDGNVREGYCSSATEERRAISLLLRNLLGCQQDLFRPRVSRTQLSPARTRTVQMVFGRTTQRKRTRQRMTLLNAMI